MKNNRKTESRRKSKIEGDIDLVVKLADRANRIEAAYEQSRKTLAIALFERNMLAKLAADGPAFTSPMEVIVARGIRDAVLAKALGMSPNGSLLN